MSGPVDPSQHDVSPVSPREERLVEGEETQQPGQAFSLEKPTEAQAAQEPSPLEPVPPATVQEGLDRLSTKVGALQTELTPERYDELTAGQKGLLETKFNQFNDHVKNLSTHLNTPYEPPPRAQSAIKTYLGWLTNGQSQIQTIAQNLGKQGAENISPAAMIRAQAQLVAADRAINFASAVAAKSADFIKTMMQTQI